MKSKIFLLIINLVFIIFSSENGYSEDVSIWQKAEISFNSSVTYDNPLQDVKAFQVTFRSPSGRSKTINGFWDGGTIWKARFMPDETGLWRWTSSCSDIKNIGLDKKSGEFTCLPISGNKDFQVHGAVIRQPGLYYLTYADGTPFFFQGCTAWNGALKSTGQEWDTYLRHRVENHYSVIQFVTTQWRGCDKNSLGQVAFEGSGRIRINPEFFRLIDSKIDRINEFGLIAAPVVLWALQNGSGRELSPGYYLPDDQAILLARYIVARYGGNHVIWFLGGDGIYTGTYEQRWKTIGRAVFDGTHQGIVAQHPCGKSWIGDIYKDEKWLDIVGYQSSHSNEKGTVEWITKGPMTREWNLLPSRPLINLEPNYEEIRKTITDRDVRNAVFWSLFSTPIAGVTYGANGIWPWLRKGEKILNHSDAPWTSTWDKSIELPGSIQMGYIGSFIRKFEWWNLYPSQEILVNQPGDSIFNSFVSVVKSPDNYTILTYLPVKSAIVIRKPLMAEYNATWFNPKTNRYSEANIKDDGSVIMVTSPEDTDLVLVLQMRK